METNMLRKALWVFLKPLITLITNLLNPEKGEEWLTELNKFNRKEPCWVRTTYTAIIDYVLPLAAMIQLGKYDRINDDITAEHFPIAGEGKWEVEYELVHLNRSIRSDDVLAEIKNRGLEPAKIEELLAFGAKYPEIQRQFPIAALGSVTRVYGQRLVSCLCRGVSKRYLNLYMGRYSWSAGWRFLAVRNRRRLSYAEIFRQEMTR
jgi:hypothetical protein